MKTRIILGLFLISSLVIPAYAQSGQYPLSIDEHTFDVQYSVNAEVLAMEIDQELNSLLIGLDNTQDSIFEIHLPDEMISAIDDEFAILVDWVEVDYEIIELQYIRAPDIPVTVVQFPVPEGALEVEIIGTHVIPEFPIGVMLIFATVFIGVIAISRKYNFLGRNFV